MFLFGMYSGESLPWGYTDEQDGHSPILKTDN